MHGEPGDSEVPLTIQEVVSDEENSILESTKNLNLDHHYRAHHQLYMSTCANVFAVLQCTTVMDEPMKVSK